MEDSLPEAYGARPARLRQDEGELVTAVLRDEIDLTAVPGEYARYVLECPASREMAVAVVVLLQIVDIEHHEGEERTESKGALHLETHGSNEEAIVVYSSKTVCYGLYFELFIKQVVLEGYRRLVGHDREEMDIVVVEPPPRRIVDRDDDSEEGVLRYEGRGDHGARHVVLAQAFRRQEAQIEREDLLDRPRILHLPPQPVDDTGRFRQFLDRHLPPRILQLCRILDDAMILEEYHHRLPRWQDVEGVVEYLMKYYTIILARTDQARDLRKGLEQYVLLVDGADLPVEW